MRTTHGNHRYCQSSNLALSSILTTAACMFIMPLYYSIMLIASINSRITACKRPSQKTHCLCTPFLPHIV